MIGHSGSWNSPAERVWFSARDNSPYEAWHMDLEADSMDD